jgi:hypothetical protein
MSRKREKTILIVASTSKQVSKYMNKSQYLNATLPNIPYSTQRKKEIAAMLEYKLGILSMKLS